MPISPRASADSIYRLIFLQHGDAFEIYAKDVNQSDVYGFIEADELVFGNRSDVVVDPSEEKLKQTFQGVKRTLIPMQAIVRIDEVAQVGTAKVLASDKSGNISFFPPQGPTS